MSSAKKRVVGAMMAVMAVGLIAGCKTTGVDLANRRVATIESAQKSLTTANAAVSNTVATLELLRKPDADLAATYASLKKQVADVAKGSEKIKAATASIEQAGKSQFDAWKLEMDTIQDENMKKESLKRMEASVKKHEAILKLFKESPAVLDPFVSSLNDIVKVLELDLTSAGVKSIDGNIKKAGKNGESVQKWIAEVVAELSK